MTLDLGLGKPGPAVRIGRRSLGVAGVLVVLLLGFATAGIVLGDYPDSPAQALRALFGAGDDRLATIFVRDLRLPRVLAAIGVGVALGTSGGLLQAASDNVLSSPDLIGFTAGSATGAIVVIILLAGGPAEISAGALVGGTGAAAVMYLLGFRRGAVTQQLVLVGVGLGAVLSAVNHLLLTRSSLDAAQTAAQWLAGSLNAVTWAEVDLLGPVLLVLVPSALVLSRPLSLLALGQETSLVLGSRPVLTRNLAVLLSVALASVATATTGPVAFVALASAQIARRLTRAPGPNLAVSALTGAVLVLGCDVIGRHLTGSDLPVGVVTGTLGGVYLVWLLRRERGLR
ncbi:iron chelate uptake ABC transporter family permease subunit [Kineosporia sp. J2-2]|uniref:Iron chelate uptake ABC transporter family permease subunit n=1 Tax=Kineosporia corallincola TaxID=2835133 RepID=A0ABS5TER8_9ACTN|nr:iron chelate uptake ABC transporter family permease subunit [Kineosporia corallincola]MBT0769575.1 iron chelate uptake ABC transporter family permease subunit [Kineosporia corallincola]